MKLIYFIGFSRSSYLVLFYYSNALDPMRCWHMTISRYMAASYWSNAQDTGAKPNKFYSVFRLSFFYLLKVDKRTISRKPKA